MRFDVSARSIYAVVEPGSCFAGTLVELALAADRIYMLDAESEPHGSVVLSEMNFGALPAVYQESRLSARFYGDAAVLDKLRTSIGRHLSARPCQCPTQLRRQAAADRRSQRLAHSETGTGPMEPASQSWR